MESSNDQWPDLRIDEVGELSPLGEGARAAFQMRKGLWRLTPSQEDLLILQRVNGETSDERISLAGSLRENGVLDLINFLHTSQKGGTLTVVRGSICKALLFEGGNVISAMSNQEEDRLGELLYRYGKISRETLESALREVGSQRRLGKVLVDRGAINSHELWTFIRKQIEEIFFSLLMLAEGSFFFSVPGKPDHFPAHVPMSCQALLMEGVRRIDELRYFRDVLPTPDVVIEPTLPPPPGVRLDPVEEIALQSLTRPMTVSELARVSRLGAFETTKALFHLIQSGAVRKRETGAPEAPARDSDRLESLVDTFNQIFREIFQSIDSTGKAGSVRDGIHSFLAAHGYADLFRGVPLARTGELSREALLGNMKEIQPQNPTEYLYSCLNELLFFEIFQARELLGQEEEQALMGRVNALFQQLR